MSDNPLPGARFLQSEPTPLTRRNEDGAVYERSPAVERQLREILPLEKEKLLTLLQVSNRDDERFLLEETLVYLMREFRKANETELGDAVTQTLFRRCQKLVARRVGNSLNNEDAAIECGADALNELFPALADVSTDKADFAQVRFNLYVKRIINRHVEKARKQLSQDVLTDSLDDAGENEDAAPLDIAAAPEMSYENIEYIEKALEVLPPEIRQAFVLRHYYGWQIESEDPDEPTISKHFGKTQRTIRNWLNKADDALQRWRKGQN